MRQTRKTTVLFVCDAGKSSSRIARNAFSMFLEEKKLADKFELLKAGVAQYDQHDLEEKLLSADHVVVTLHLVANGVEKRLNRLFSTASKPVLHNLVSTQKHEIRGVENWKENLLKAIQRQRQ